MATDKKNNTASPSPRPVPRTGWRRYTDNIATFGLLLVCVALLVPLINIFTPTFEMIMKWVYAAGALIYTLARVTDLAVKGESFRVRRLRHMEFWAGISFCIAAGLWFYHGNRLGGHYGMTLGVVRDTVVFTIVGAVLQIVASWLLSAQLRKEQKEQNKVQNQNKA